MLWDWTIWSALMCCGINGQFSLIKRRTLELLKVEELLQQPFNRVMGRSLSLISRPSQQKLRTSPPYELPFFRRNFTMSSSPLRQAPCKIETKWAPPMSHKNWTKYVMEQECMMTSSSLTMMSTCTTWYYWMEYKMRYSFSGSSFGLGMRIKMYATHAVLLSDAA